MCHPKMLITMAMTVVINCLSLSPDSEEYATVIFVRILNYKKNL